MILIGFIIMWASCGGFCAFIAKDKNRNPGAWFCLGFLFGLLALISILGVSSQKPLQEQISQETIRTQQEDFQLGVYNGPPLREIQG
jgi:hypothetical protein